MSDTAQGAKIGSSALLGKPDPRWTYACTHCDWIGNVMTVSWLYGFCDCPRCGESCTEDEPSFEPRAGCLDGDGPGFDPVWPPNSQETR